MKWTITLIMSLILTQGVFGGTLSWDEGDLNSIDSFSSSLVYSKYHFSKSKSSIESQYSISQNSAIRSDSCAGEVVISEPYSFKILAETGKNLVDNINESNFQLDYFSPWVSINDSSDIIFEAIQEEQIEYLNKTGIENLFVVEGNKPPKKISFFSDPYRSIFTGSRINNKKNTVSTETIVGSVPHQFVLRTWGVNDSAYIDSVRVISPKPRLFNYNTKATNSSFNGYPAINNHDEIVFSITDDTSAAVLELEYPDQLVRSEIPIRPVFADNGVKAFTVRENFENSILIYEHRLTDSEKFTLASPDNGFVSLGLNLGISDDGEVIAFYGELSSSSHDTSNEGLGVFVAFKNNQNQWVIMRVAGVSQNGQLDPGESWSDLNSNGILDKEEDLSSISHISLANGIGVNQYKGTKGTNNNGEYNVCFAATDTSNEIGIFLSRFNLDSLKKNSEPNIIGKPICSKPLEVVSTNSTWHNRYKEIRGINIYDPINTKGEIAFWAELDDGKQVIVKSIPYKTPLILLPGIVGCFPKTSAYDFWLLNRGVDPNILEIDPLGGVYNNHIDNLVQAGYVLDEDLFVANYDWRMPPGPEDGKIDGHLSGLSAKNITNGVFKYGVDYLGYWLKYVIDRYKQRGLDPPEEVDIITHSTGGLVARAYLQSDAYNGEISDEIKLPKVRNLFMIGVPNRGASKAWNPLENNWISDIAYALALSKLIFHAYKQVSEKNQIINGPDRVIGRNDILVDGLPDPKTFIKLYVPTIQSLLATYPFILNNNIGNLPAYPEINKLNKVLLDLNIGDILDDKNSIDRNTFSEKTENCVIIYSSNHCTPTFVREVDPDSDLNKKRYFLDINGLCAPAHLQQSIINANGYTIKMSDFIPANPINSTFYFDIWESQAGDGTVPFRSSAAQFIGDDRFVLVPIRDNECSDHTKIMSNAQTKKTILVNLGFKTDQINHLNIANNCSKSQRERDLSFFYNLLVDPIQTKLIDASGKRMGYNNIEGVMNDFDRGYWIGKENAIGWITDTIAEPLKLEIVGDNEEYVITATKLNRGRFESFKYSGFVNSGDTITEIIDFKTYTDSIAPSIEIIIPDSSRFIDNNESLTFSYEIKHDSDLQTAFLAFDINGNKKIDDDTEYFPLDNQLPKGKILIDSLYGPPGEREISVYAADSSANIGYAAKSIVFSDSLSALFNSIDVEIIFPKGKTVSTTDPSLEVALSVLDNDRLKSLLVVFDTNGDGIMDRFGEVITPVRMASGLYNCTIEGISGPIGTRELKVIVADTSNYLNLILEEIEVADTEKPEILLESPTPGQFVTNEVDVNFRIKDESAIDSIAIYFDENGNGNFDLNSEVKVISSPVKDQKYLVEFNNIAGKEGWRFLKIDAFDIYGNSTNKEVRLAVGNDKPLLFNGYSTSYDKIINLGEVQAVDISENTGELLIAGQNQVVLIDRVKDSVIYSFHGHQDRITTVDFSKDEKYLLTGSRDNVLNVYDRISGKFIAAFTHTYQNKRFAINQAKFSPDGKYIVSCTEALSLHSNDSINYPIWVWNLKDHTLFTKLVGHETHVNSISFSKNGEYLISGDEAGKTILWDMDLMSKVKIFSGHTSVKSVDFSLDSLILTGGDQARIWNVNNGATILLDGHIGTVMQVGFINNKLLTATENGLIKIWNRYGNLLETISSHKNGVNSIATSRKHSIALSGGVDGSVKLWNIDSTSEQRFYNHSNNILNVNFSSEESMIVSNDRENVYLIDVYNNQIIDSLVNLAGPISAVRYIERDSMFYVSRLFPGQILSKKLNEIDTSVIYDESVNISCFEVSQDGRVGIIGRSGSNDLLVLNLVKKEVIDTLVGLKSNPSFGSISKGGTTIVAANDLNMICVWDNPSRDPSYCFTSSLPNSFFTSIMLSPDSSLIVAGKTRGNVEVFDAQYGHMKYFRMDPTKDINTVGFTNLGKYIFASNGSTVSFWDIESNELIKSENIYSIDVAINSLGDKLASARTDKSISLLCNLSNVQYNFDGGHYGNIATAIISKNDSIIITGGTDNKVKVFDSETGRVVRNFGGHSSKVYSLGLSTDNRLLVTGGDNPRVNIWNLETGSIFKTIQLPTALPYTNNAVYSLAFSPDDSFVTIGTDQNVAYKYDIATEKLSPPLIGHNKIINTMSISSNGKSLLTGGRDGVGILWDLESLDMKSSYSDHSETINTFKFSHDSTFLISSSDDGTFKIWDKNLAMPSWTAISNNSTPFKSAFFSNNNNHIITINVEPNGGIARIWDYDNRDVLTNFQLDGNALTTAFTDYSESKIITVEGSIIKFWNKPEVNLNRVFTAHPLAISSLMLIGNNEIITGSCDLSVKWWDLEDLTTIKTFTGHTECIIDIETSPNNKYLLTSDTYTGKIWNINDGSSFRDIYFRDYSLRDFVWSNDDNEILLCGEGLSSSLCAECGFITLYDIKNRKVIFNIKRPFGVNKVAISPNNEYIISGGTASSDYKVEIWDLDSLELIRSLSGHSAEITGLKFTNDGSLFISSSKDGTVIVWDLLSGKKIHKFLHPIAVNSLILDNSSKVLASISGQTVYLWSLETGNIMNTLGHKVNINSGDFSEDGSTFYSSDENGLVKVWTLEQ